MPELSLIAAVSRNGVIGAQGGLPWHIPDDLKFFRRITMGHAIVMGRKTYASIGRALPGRRNLVVSRDRAYVAPGCEVFPDLASALATAREHDPAPIVIGGAEIYAQAMPDVTRMYLTEVARDVEGDVFFPPWVPTAWDEVERIEGDGVVWRTLVRRLA